MAEGDPRSRRYVPEADATDRTEFERDRDRLLYSSAFARLAGVTQVATSLPGQTFHNRLTHTLKVGQLSSRLAKRLRGQYGGIAAAAELDPDAAEASALAHDLGHPPFGHLGEATLGTLAEASGTQGFDANAQSFRVITKIARRSVDFDGLNLTRYVLDGSLKYPWLRAEAVEGEQPTLQRDKWGAYDSELDQFNFARGRDPGTPAQRFADERGPSLVAQVVDWADDVTYAIHDLEDFYKAGLIDLGSLVRRDAEATEFLDSFCDSSGELRGKFADHTRDELSSALEGLRGLFAIGLARPYDRSLELRALVRLQSSYLIGEYFRAVALETDASGHARLRMDGSLRAEVTVLKELLWFYVINRPSFAAIQVGQRGMIERLFESLTGASRDSREWRVFPKPVQEALRSGPGTAGDSAAVASRSRIVIDYLAGMTEFELAYLYQTMVEGRPSPSFVLSR